ncbi:MipA/OmpV family protein [Thermithiobacillus plumbiphilus]|uniref:MipA/OmpV family protein n=1 Tax=Thermithiobacillus plumbiphilus TaxID=1729899 RepID=A0ABU9DA63_9PROT
MKQKFSWLLGLACWPGLVFAAVVPEIPVGAEAVAAAATTPAPKAAEPALPRWELGLGTAVLNTPDYRGADQGQTYVLPLPYVIYRGEVLRVSRGGVKGTLFRSQRLHLDMSLNASTPVESEGNEARRGMPDLDPSFELGPSLQVVLRKTSGPLPGMSLRLPVRGVLAVARDFGRAEYVGWVAAPDLSLNWQGEGRRPWRAGMTLGPLFGDRSYHDYYYSVDPAFATADRPAYQARAGYSGMRLAGAVTRRLDKIWAGAFFRYDDLSGVVFEDSPLLREKHALMTGFGIAWVFAESRAKARTPASEPEP